MKVKTVNDYWKEIIHDYDIINKIDRNGQFIITANEIKKYKEPRLMAKWDSNDSLPGILKENKINILPISRNAYVMGKFNLYEPLPPLNEHVKNMSSVTIPSFETIDINNISSEANAINVLVISEIMDEFLELEYGDKSVGTFNGRMGTGIFNFQVNTHQGTKESILVNNAQCEIDGGFENNKSVIIMEAKNVVHPDFHIRQLYYPYRLWLQRVNKPIRLIFSVYSNQIYRLFEYEFEDPNNYSSIILKKQKNYSFQDTNISMDEIVDVWKHTKPVYSDNMCIKSECTATFIQADTFDRVISLMENLHIEPLSPDEIAELMQFVKRQADYYFNAGKYLEIFERGISDEGQVIIKLTKTGNNIMKLRYKERILKLLEQIFKHSIFHDLFEIIINTGEIPNKQFTITTMKNLNVTTESLLERRSSTVRSWLEWIVNLVNI